MAHCRTTTLIPLCLITTIILAVYMMNHVSPSPTPNIPTPQPHKSPPTTTHLIYTAPPDYFAQALPTTNASTFDPLTTSLGLLPQPYDTDPSLPPHTPQWTRFTHKLMTLNADSPKTISYRLLFLSRHGEGWHNVAEQFFGTERWDCVYAGLEGSQRVRWADAELTARGVEQAEIMSGGWGRLIEKEGVSLPERFYVSPLRRAVSTAEVTFKGLVEADGDGAAFRPIVKEGLREGVGIHTCDRRSTRREIRRAFPEVEIEEGFAEEDPLWVPDLREPGTAQTRRLRGLLDDVFMHDASLFISMTSHGGTIQSILRAVGHREFNVPTGGVIPVVVRVEVVQGERGREDEISWERKPECVGGEPDEKEVEEMLRRLDESVNGTGF